MYCFYFVLFVAAAQGFTVNRVSRETHLGKPSLYHLSAEEGPVFLIEWKSVQNPDKNNPVLGYKVKIWELPNVKTYKYEKKNGVYVLVEGEKPAEMDPFEVPDSEPRVLKFDAATTRAIISGIKYDTYYEIRVQAYTKTEDGPLSDATGAKLLKDEQTDKQE